MNWTKGNRPNRLDHCPFATSKNSSRKTLDIFCVAAPVNLLPSSATGSGRSRNQMN